LEKAGADGEMDFQTFDAEQRHGAGTLARL
jgi:hypothetical protein